MIGHFFSIFINFWCLRHKESMANVSAVVNGQTNCNNVVDNRDTVESNVPEVQKTKEEQIN